MRSAEPQPQRAARPSLLACSETPICNPRRVVPISPAPLISFFAFSSLIFFLYTPPAEVNANENHQVWYHRVGTSQAEDVFVFATPETPKYFVGGSVSDDGRRAAGGRACAAGLVWV